MDYEKGAWIRVTRANPCKICEKGSWCSVSEDGEVVRCMRAQNNRPSPGKDGTVGYIWQLTEKVDIDKLIQHEKKDKPERLTLEQIAELHDKFVGHREAERKREEEGEKLGVRPSTLRSMEVGVGWDERGAEFSSWPSRNGDGKIVGIVRRYASGKKLTYPGTSNSGVFTPAWWWHRMGPVLIVEGGSDTAALTDANLCALGRPSNTGGAQFIARMMQRHRPAAKLLVIVEEDVKDTSKIPARLNHREDCEGCLMCWPG